MTYVEGGYYLSKSDCLGICAMIALNPVSVTMVAVGLSLAKKAVKAVSTAIGGFIGWAEGVLLAAAIGVVSAQIITMARGGISYQSFLFWCTASCFFASFLLDATLFIICSTEYVMQILPHSLQAHIRLDDKQHIISRYHAI